MGFELGSLESKASTLTTVMGQQRWSLSNEGKDDLSLERIVTGSKVLMPRWENKEVFWMDVTL